MSYCSTVCSVLLQHCMFFLTAALYVPSCRSVFPVLLQPVKSQGVKISGHLLAIHLPRSVIHAQSQCGKNLSRPSLTLFCLHATRHSSFGIKWKRNHQRKNQKKMNPIKKHHIKKHLKKRNCIKKHQGIIIYFYFVANKTNLQADLGDLWLESLASQNQCQQRPELTPLASAYCN